jgi:hypothetical protein
VEQRDELVAGAQAGCPAVDLLQQARTAARLTLERGPARPRFVAETFIELLDDETAGVVRLCVLVVLDSGILSPHCDHVAELVAKAVDETLTPRERQLLRVGDLEP